LTKPFLDNIQHGVFATRAPNRPNPIGLSVVRIIKIEKNIIYVENVDILDETPLLDIKPYIPAFDIHKTEKNGWIENKTDYLNETKSDRRFE
jgi:tRNA-Thr(GGU) m(6)t(6)A37 methyltransferase TsaA